MADSKRLRDDPAESLDDSNLSEVHSPPTSKQRVMSPMLDKYEDAPESAQKGSDEGASANGVPVENREGKSEFKQILELLGVMRNERKVIERK